MSLSPLPCKYLQDASLRSITAPQVWYTSRFQFYFHFFFLAVAVDTISSILRCWWKHSFIFYHCISTGGDTGFLTWPRLSLINWSGKRVPVTLRVSLEGNKGFFKCPGGDGKTTLHTFSEVPNTTTIRQTLRQDMTVLLSCPALSTKCPSTAQKVTESHKFINPALAGPHVCVHSLLDYRNTFPT